jgi:hypothetical protein
VIVEAPVDTIATQVAAIFEEDQDSEILFDGDKPLIGFHFVNNDDIARRRLSKMRLRRELAQVDMEPVALLLG